MKDVIERHALKTCLGITILMLAFTGDVVRERVSWSVITANWFNASLIIFNVLVLVILMAAWWHFDKLEF